MINGKTVKIFSFLTFMSRKMVFNLLNCDYNDKIFHFLEMMFIGGRSFTYCFVWYTFWIEANLAEQRQQ